MSLFWSTTAFILVGGLTAGFTLLPATARAQQPAAAWFPFQVDSHLALQVPGAARQLPASVQGGEHRQVYVVQTPQAVVLLLRQELPAKVATGDLDVFYTGLAQTLLTQTGATGEHQASFRLDSLEGLAMDFRLTNPKPGLPATGTLWVLRVGQTAYLAQWLARQGLPAEEARQKQRFLASWRLTHLPTTPPTAAELQQLHVGEFRDESNTTITRRDTMQTEVNSALGLRIVYGLKWTADGYEMRQRSSTSRYAALLQAKPIHVRITAVQGNTYWYRATTDEYISTGQIRRIGK
jgi:hypothetical protein